MLAQPTCVLLGTQVYNQDCGAAIIRFLNPYEQWCQLTSDRVSLNKMYELKKQWSNRWCWRTKLKYFYGVLSNVWVGVGNQPGEATRWNRWIVAMVGHLLTPWHQDKGYGTKVKVKYWALCRQFPRFTHPLYLYLPLYRHILVYFAHHDQPFLATDKNLSL